MSDGTEVDRIDRSPALLSSALAVGAAVVATTSVPGSPTALAFGVTGVLVLGVGLAAGRQSLVTVAGATLVGAVLTGGVMGVPVLPVLVGVTAALLAFDFGSTAIALGEQLGREAPTVRVELVHATASTLVGLVFVVTGFAIHETATGGQPLSAVLGLVLAAVILLAALRRADPISG